ncbi:PEP-CTERM sorting domain-containing protein [Roseofilum sp. Guam]|uniref:PEP-CTERM sorting domain-containing protein n=1 Tax=Roseofilum sp. Guam TaxID=2821502 RepID=UPI001B247CA8|nr:PEP-CTERM sorting domain-containing protein [Roseofilum sp. Guam]MBP0028983.1 PEP-CTERM sorting domain-containing protein [Roseofilum sp. Guam]
MNQRHLSIGLGSSLSLGLMLTALTAIGSESAHAATLSGQKWDGSSTSLTWNESNAVTGGSIVSGTPSSFAFPGGFNGLLQSSQTVGEIFGEQGQTSLELEKSGAVGTIELDWGGNLLANEEGNDLVVYENGGVGAPEAFAVSVRKAGETDFSEYLYQFSDHFSATYQVFATVFDLSSFGLGAGDAIDAIRIRNLAPSDLVSGSDGQGFLGGSYTAFTHAGGSGFDINTKLDADITYVAGLNDVFTPLPPSEQPSDVPEPSAILGLVGVGLLGLGTRLRARQR